MVIQQGVEQRPFVLCFGAWPILLQLRRLRCSSSCCCGGGCGCGGLIQSAVHLIRLVVYLHLSIVQDGTADGMESRLSSEMCLLSSTSQVIMCILHGHY